jgi:multiple sugar transport system permease protein
MTAPSVPRARRRVLPRRSGVAWRRARWGYVFIAPWIFGFLIFTLLPMIATLAFTFTNISLAQEEPLRLVGLRNYATLVGDKQTWDSLIVTFKYALLALPVAVALPLLVALALHSRHLRGSGAFRVLFYLPYVIPFIAGVLIWGGMLSNESGWINDALRAVGIEHPPDWLQDPTWIYSGLAIMGIWGIGAGMIVYLAGLKGIPSELYDAARIDGAGAIAQHRHITIPMISPVIFYTLILAVVEVLQYFLVPLVLKNGTGEPGGSTYFYNLYIYKNFFTFQNMAYGATLAWLLFGITLGLTLLLFWLSRRWVYYAGEVR